MSVEELIRRLKECDPVAEVFVNDEPLDGIEEIETENGPGIILWPKE